MPLVAENHGHIWHKCECDLSTHCMFCDGGICSCTRCDAAEGTLTTHCPGIKVSNEHQQLVYENDLDFRSGEWIRQGIPAWEIRNPFREEFLLDAIDLLNNQTRTNKGPSMAGLTFEQCVRLARSAKKSAQRRLECREIDIAHDKTDVPFEEQPTWPAWNQALMMYNFWTQRVSELEAGKTDVTSLRHFKEQWARRTK